jgi:hypothetical protein
MNLTRLAFTQYPRPPQRELRQRGVFDSGGRLIGHVVNIYVDDDRNFRFVDVALSSLMGLQRVAMTLNRVARWTHEKAYSGLPKTGELVSTVKRGGQ